MDYIEKDRKKSNLIFSEANQLKKLVREEISLALSENENQHTEKSNSTSYSVDQFKKLMREEISLAISENEKRHTEKSNSTSYSVDQFKKLMREEISLAISENEKQHTEKSNSTSYSVDKLKKLVREEISLALSKNKEEIHEFIKDKVIKPMNAMKDEIEPMENLFSRLVDVLEKQNSDPSDTDPGEEKTEKLTNPRKRPKGFGNPSNQKKRKK
ncbi:MAG: hypothetical protein QNJ54_28280 [Prochloraceae cyanobacterium]|nr:hypothetical protein [Prochloraceae cyanobacterium]